MYVPKIKLTSRFLFAVLVVCATFDSFADEREYEDDKDQNEVELCGQPDPILSTADFNGDGIVDKLDKLLVTKAVDRDLYIAFYDINADGELDKKDIEQTEEASGMPSSILDRQKSFLFHQVKQFQHVDSKAELNAMLFRQGTGALAGHGEHWQNEISYLTLIGQETPNPMRAEGLNVDKDTGKVHALFWGKAALPVFANGATDFPKIPGDWMNSQVIAFADNAPRFTNSTDEVWHTHAGLCSTAEATENGVKLHLNQHTTFLECQALPSIWKTPENPYNGWFNIWMIHAWMFDLNPNGFFAGTHPCLDQDAISEHEINGDREVPHFFRHH